METPRTLFEYAFSTRTLNLGDRLEEGINPFTDAAVSYPIDDGMTDGEAAAVRAIFVSAGIEGPEPHQEGYAIYWSDGGSLRFRGPDLVKIRTGHRPNGFNIELLSVTTTPSLEALSIILDVARFGNLALFEVGNEAVRIVGRAPTGDELRRWPKAQTVESVSDLSDWLTRIVRPRKVTPYWWPQE